MFIIRNSKSCCGSGIFTAPWFLGFTGPCSRHDELYNISQNMYVESFLSGDVSGKLEALQMKQASDITFALECREEARKSFILIRIVKKLIAELFISLVFKHSQSIWMKSVLDKVAGQMHVKLHGQNLKVEPVHGLLDEIIVTVLLEEVIKHS